MAYQVGSLADLISGTHDAGSICTKIMYVPVQVNKSPRAQITNETPRTTTLSRKRNKILVNKLDLQNSEKRKKRKYSMINESPKIEQKCEKESEIQQNFDKESEIEQKFEKEPETKFEKVSHLLIKKPRIRDVETESRTIFVKNLPHVVYERQIKKHFQKYGPVESVRLRCAAVKDTTMKKKIAVIQKDFHPERSNICAFVRFKDLKSVEKALEANGSLFGGHHIFVDKAMKEEKHDQRKAVFLGNVPFGAEENEIWETFTKCGEIVDIRIVRDNETGLGKGFAFVNFKSTDAVELAVSLDGVQLKDKELRVSRAVKKPMKLNKSGNFQQTKAFHSKKNIGGSHDGVRNLNKKNNPNNRGNSKNENVFEANTPRKLDTRCNKAEVIGGKGKKRTNSLAEHGQQRKLLNQEFQGQKTTDKKIKKKKTNKDELRKKIIAKKLAHVSSKHKNAQ